MTSKSNGVIMDPGASLPRRSAVRGYFENRGWCILIWLMLVGLWLSIEWLANLLSVDKWVVVVGFFVVGYLIYHFLLKGSPSKDETHVEKGQEIFARDMEREWEKEKYCWRCGNLNSVRVTKDHKIVVYCSRCDEGE